MNDSATAEKTELTLTKIIRAKREKVFQAWTNPQWVSHWFAPGNMTVPNADIHARVGGSYRIRMLEPDGQSHITYGNYQEIVPNEKLVFTWGWEGPNRYESLVTILFSDNAEGTKLTLIHQRLANTEAVEKHTQGWEGCLANLAARINQFT